MKTSRAVVLLATATLASGAIAVAAVAGNGSLNNPFARNASSTSAAPSSAASAPSVLGAFYSVRDPLPAAPPGRLLKSEKVTVPRLHGDAYRVMYTSRSLRDQTVAVTGIVLVPKGAAPSGGFPVVTWGHGTTGMADACAPSTFPPAAGPPTTNDLLDRGWVVATSDYEGQGTPGVLPYLAGVSAARNAIDIVRAARHLAEAHASSDYAVWGYSEGGQTAMFALDIATTYAPELHLKGVVAGAPPSQLERLYDFLKTSSHRYYLLMLLVGLNAAYGDAAAPLDEILSPAGMALVPDIENSCLAIPRFGLLQPADDLLPHKLAEVSIASAIKTDPFTVPAWRKILLANDAETFDTAQAAPLLIVQGSADEQIPSETSKILAKHECDIGQNVERWVYANSSHSTTLVISSTDAAHWIGDRFAGVDGPDSYVPKAQRHVERTLCPA